MIVMKGSVLRRGAQNGKMMLRELVHRQLRRSAAFPEPAGAARTPWIVYTVYIYDSTSHRTTCRSHWTPWGAGGHLSKSCHQAGRDKIHRRHDMDAIIPHPSSDPTSIPWFQLILFPILDPLHQGGSLAMGCITPSCGRPVRHTFLDESRPDPLARARSLSVFNFQDRRGWNVTCQRVLWWASHDTPLAGVQSSIRV